MLQTMTRALVNTPLGTQGAITGLDENKLTDQMAD
jgi:hypothetical protein